MNGYITALVPFLLMLFSCEDNSAKTANTFPVNTKKHSQLVVKESKLKKELQWAAYKTNSKIVVHGTFAAISLSNTKERKTLEESLDGAIFSCDGATVTTGDTARDGTLATFFFKRLSSPQITGSFGKFENNKVPITLVLNEKTITKEFAYSSKAKNITIKGSIDIVKDFGADKAFNSLHKACYDLHMGKTWTEVDLVVKISN